MKKKNIKILNLNYRSLVFYIENALVKYSKNNVLKTIIGISSIAGDRGKKKQYILICKSWFFKLFRWS